MSITVVQLLQWCGFRIGGMCAGMCAVVYEDFVIFPQITPHTTRAGDRPTKM
jgi:hypothetical protein